MSDPHSHSPPSPSEASDASSAVAQHEQERRRQRDEQEARQREERDRARQEETARREQQRVAEAQRRIEGQSGPSHVMRTQAIASIQPTAPINAPESPHQTVPSSSHGTPDPVEQDERRRSREAMVQILANRATTQQARANLATNLAARERMQSRSARQRTRQVDAVAPRPIAPPFPPGWMDGETSPIARASWMETEPLRTAVQHAVVEAWLAEREAAATSVWQRIRIVVACFVIGGLILGAIAVLLAM